MHLRELALQPLPRRMGPRGRYGTCACWGRSLVKLCTVRAIWIRQRALASETALCGSVGRGGQSCLFLLLLSSPWLLSWQLSLQRGNRWTRVLNAGHGDEVHGASGICPTLGVVLCPRLYILVWVRRRWVENERRARDDLLLCCLLRLRVYLGEGVL
jgi:hypothetical protein